MVVKNFEQYHKLNEEDSSTQENEIRRLIRDILLKEIDAVDDFLNLGNEIDVIETYLEDYDITEEPNAQFGNLENYFSTKNSDIYKLYSENVKLTDWAENARQGYDRDGLPIMEILKDGIVNYYEDLLSSATSYLLLNVSQYADVTMGYRYYIENPLIYKMKRNKVDIVNGLLRLMQLVSPETYSDLIDYIKEDLPQANIELYKDLVKFIKDGLNIPLSEDAINLAIDASKHRESGLF